MTTAAASARAAADFILGRQPPQFERLVHVMVNRLLDLVQFFLGIQEIARHSVLEQPIAVFLEISNFLARQLHAGLLFLLQRLPFVHQGFIIGTRRVIAHEGVDALAD